MKDIDQQLQFDMKNRMKLVNFNNVEIVIVNLQNIKKNCFQNIMIILTSSIEFELIYSSFIEITIKRLNFRMRSNLCKVEYIECFYTNSKKIKESSIENLFKSFITFIKIL